MNSRDIRRGDSTFSNLLLFIRLFKGDLPSKEAAHFAALAGIDNDLKKADRGFLKDVYEESLLILGNRASEIGFPDYLLRLQKGLYTELEYLHALDTTDGRHDFIVVVPVADRPEMLRNFVQSLIGQCEDFNYGGKEGGFYRKNSLLIMDDSADAKNREIIREIARDAELRGIRTRYVGMEEQALLARQSQGLAGEKVSLLIGSEDIGRFHKGAAVTRNLAYLYLNALLRERKVEEKVLIWFLDSDEEFRIKVQREEDPADIRFINYFYQLDRIFRESRIQVLTGKVVGDPPVAPSVMINTFLDDLLDFLAKAITSQPGEECPFHGGRRVGAFSAEYHDMAELFGYKRTGVPAVYRCTLTGPHTTEDCLRDFSEKSLDFFYGLHPTRVQYYQHDNDPLRTEAARTVYTGNYVMRPEALRYFIPFAGLKLRMAGPTLGRILKSSIKEKFVSANLPLLHRRTLSNRREFRSGVSVKRGAPDLSEEFVRQFWGDVMLFSIEELTSRGFPGRRPDLAEIRSTVNSVQGGIWKIYLDQKSAITEKTSKAREYFSGGDKWWDGGEVLAAAVQNFNDLCSLVEHNFGRDSKALKNLSAQINGGSYSEVLIQAIHEFREDAVLWDKLLKGP